MERALIKISGPVHSPWSFYHKGLRKGPKKPDSCTCPTSKQNPDQEGNISCKRKIHGFSLVIQRQFVSFISGSDSLTINVVIIAKVSRHVNKQINWQAGRNVQLEWSSATRDERAAMVPGLSTAAGAGSAPLEWPTHAGLWWTDPEVVGISCPPLLLLVSTTRNYLQTGPNRIKSQMGTNILILTRNQAQVLASLYHL